MYLQNNRKLFWRVAPLCAKTKPHLEGSELLLEEGGMSEVVLIFKNGRELCEGEIEGKIPSQPHWMLVRWRKFRG